MLTVTFWNTRGLSLPERIVSLARHSDPDILILAECDVEMRLLVRELNRNQQRLFFPDPGNSDRLVLLSRLERVAILRDHFGVSIRGYTLPVGGDVLLVAAHLASKLRTKTEDQEQLSSRLREYIREAEATVGHTRTILIGDLNMNPFEIGMVSSEGLHAVMDRRLASSLSRMVHGERRDFFYNPMWAQFGDSRGTPPGTYFRRDGNPVCFFWNMFDQALLRPSLLDSFDDSVEIVTRIAGDTLLSQRGRPNHAVWSDHLPLVLRLRRLEETS